MRADRLLSILLLLQNRGKMTSRELARQLEVSERTILRDMDALSAAGVPVFAERGSSGGWTLQDGYRTDLSGLKPEELVSLLLTGRSEQEALGALGIRGHYEAAFQKLLAAAPEPARRSAEIVRRKLHIDGAGWRKSGEATPLLPIVQEAVWQQRLLWMRYAREDADAERTVRPLGLVAKRSVWYLAAEADGECRTYRISRMTDARMLDETFEPPADFNLEAYWERSTARFLATLPRYPAVVRVADGYLRTFAQERYVNVVRASPSAPGWHDAEVEFETLESACAILLACGRRAAALSPAELRDAVVAEAQALLQRYDEPDFS